MEYKCTPRSAWLTEMGCAAVHEIAVKEMEKDVGRFGHAYFSPADRTCAACPGVVVRFAEGLEPTPRSPGEAVVKLIERRKRELLQRPAGVGGYSRVDAFEPIPWKCEYEPCGKDMVKRNSRNRFCSRECGDRAHWKARDEAKKVIPEMRACPICGTEKLMTGRMRYCSKPCGDKADAINKKRLAQEKRGNHNLEKKA